MCTMAEQTAADGSEKLRTLIKRLNSSRHFNEDGVNSTATSVGSDGSSGGSAGSSNDEASSKGGTRTKEQWFCDDYHDVDPRLKRDVEVNTKAAATTTKKSRHRRSNDQAQQPLPPRRQRSLDAEQRGQAALAKAFLAPAAPGRAANQQCLGLHELPFRRQRSSRRPRDFSSDPPAQGAGAGAPADGGRPAVTRINSLDSVQRRQVPLSVANPATGTAAPTTPSYHGNQRPTVTRASSPFNVQKRPMPVLSMMDTDSNSLEDPGLDMRPTIQRSNSLDDILKKRPPISVVDIGPTAFHKSCHPERVVEKRPPIPSVTDAVLSAFHAFPPSKAHRPTVGRAKSLDASHRRQFQWLNAGVDPAPAPQEPCSPHLPCKATRGQTVRRPTVQRSNSLDDVKRRLTAVSANLGGVSITSLHAPVLQTRKREKRRPKAERSLSLDDVQNRPPTPIKSNEGQGPSFSIDPPSTQSHSPDNECSSKSARYLAPPIGVKESKPVSGEEQMAIEDLQQDQYDQEEDELVAAANPSDGCEDVEEQDMGEDEWSSSTSSSCSSDESEEEDAVCSRTTKPAASPVTADHVRKLRVQQVLCAMKKKVTASKQ